MRKFRSLFAVLLAIGLMMAMVACGGNTNNDWTVTVLDVDGNPYTSARVQPCSVNDDGTLGACYLPVNVDSTGTIIFAPEDAPEAKDKLEIHLAGLPAYLTFDETRISKGDSATIRLRYRGESDLNTKTGSGTEAAPYEIESGSEYIAEKQENHQYIYGFKFTEEGQKIIFAVTVYANDNYTVNTYGVDAKIVKLDSTEEGFVETDTNGNNELTFNTGAEETVVYFEVSLNGTGLNTDAYIWVE